MSRILIWDLETSSLSADSGIILCAGYKWLGEDAVECPTIRDYPYQPDPYKGDQKLVKHFHKILSQADIIVTYNGTMFDVKFFNTRALIAGLPPLPPIPHVDLYFHVKAKLRLHRSSLAALATAMELNAEKTPIKFEHWIRAAVARGSMGANAMQYIVDHCKADVRVLEEAYLKLRPLMMRHPRVSDGLTCMRCGSEHMQRRGFILPKAPLKNRKQRYQCQACGGWESRVVTRAEAQEGWR